MSVDKLGKLVNELEFRKERSLLYIAPGLLLLPSFILLLYLQHSFLGVLSGGELGLIEGRLISFSLLMLLGYVVSSSYLSYRLTKLISHHLYLSGIFSYYHARVRDDYEAIRLLFRSSLYRRTIPAPSTSLVLNALSLGLYYPLLLYIAESNFRKHVRDEEHLFNKPSGTGDIDIKDLLLNIVATVFTLGLFLSYWGIRIIRLFNNHISRIHGGDSKPPVQTDLSGARVDGVTLIKAVGLLYVGLGVSIILSNLGVPTYLLLTLGSSLMLPLFPLCLRGASIKKQVLLTLLSIYLILYSSTITGFLNIEATSIVARWFMDQASKVRDEFGLDLDHYVSYIFLNNYAISVASSVSPMNTLLIGYSISNTGAILGGLTYLLLAERGLAYGLSAAMVGLYPHAILELLAYATFVTLALNMDRLGWRRALSLFLIGTAILLASAVVEALTIVFGLRFIQQF